MIDFSAFSTAHYLLWIAGALLWVDLAILLVYMEEMD